MVIILPLIEARHSIRELLSKASSSKSDDMSEGKSDADAPAIKVLVPIDGSIRSLRAMNGTHHLLRDIAGVRLYLLHVLEWPHDDEDNTDTALSAQMQKEGGLVLRSVVVPREAGDVVRMVKLGDPPVRIAEMADKLNVDLIAMGRRGLGNTDETLGHVTRSVLEATHRPIVLLD
jgi:nucleotide-binding universal stress UspA family protein